MRRPPFFTFSFSSLAVHGREEVRGYGIPLTEMAHPLSEDFKELHATTKSV